MIRRWDLVWALLVLVGGSAAPAVAQESREERKTPVERTTEAEAKREPTAGSTRPDRPAAESADNEDVVRERLRERLRRAIRLPGAVQESRDAGVPEDKVRDVLDSARERDVPAGEVERILEVENEALRKGGSADNFGAAVQQMKASGLRGRELAEAIHAEQIARGMKKPKHGHLDRDKGKGEDRDVDEAIELGEDARAKSKGKGKTKPEKGKKQK